MTIAQQLSALLFDYRACHVTEQDVIRGVVRMTGAARLDKLESALRKLVDEAERTVLAEQDAGRDLPHLRQAVESAKELL